MPVCRLLRARFRSHAMPRSRSAPATLLVAAMLALSAVLALSTALAQQPSDKGNEWKLSTAVGPAFALGAAGERWAKRIGERSGGRLAAKLYPGAALADREPSREFFALARG